MTHLKIYQPEDQSAAPLKPLPGATRRLPERDSQQRVKCVRKTPTGEHYIPIRKRDLVELLTKDEELDLVARGALLKLAKLVEAVLHHEFHERLEELKQLYSVNDPDADPVSREEVTDDDRRARAKQFLRSAGKLLERANFRKVTNDELLASLETASEWGVNLQVDLSVFRHLEIYCRGEMTGSRVKRSWRTWFRSVNVPIPTYQRLVVMFQLKDGTEHAAEIPGALGRRDAVVLKLFKNIPKMDVDMLLPGTQIRMTLWDQGKIWLPTVSGIGIVTLKLLQGAAGIAMAGLQGTIATLSLVGGFVGYGVRSFYGYLQTKDRYQLNLTRSLYYQNLDNNAGVLFRLLDEAEEQEFREILLAYSLLLREGKLGLTSDQLDEVVQSWLKERAGIDVDFEVDDAMEKLARMKLATLTASGRWIASPIEDSLKALDHAWDHYFEYHNGPELETQRTSTARSKVLPDQAPRRAA